MTGAIADQREDLRALIVSARKSQRAACRSRSRPPTAPSKASTANWCSKLPGLIAKLDSTLTRLDSAANGANGILSENRAAINSFANDGLAQLGPTLGELRSLVRDLRRISDRLDGNPDALPARPRRAQGVRTQMKMRRDRPLPAHAAGLSRGLAAGLVLLAGCSLLSGKPREHGTIYAPEPRVQRRSRLADGALAAGADAAHRARA